MSQTPTTSGGNSNIPLEAELYEDDEDITIQQTISSIIKNIIEKNMDIDKIMDMKLSPENIRKTAMEVCSEGINLSKKMRDAKSTGKEDKNNNVSLWYGMLTLIEAIQATEATRKVSSQDKLPEQIGTNDIAYSLAKENVILKNNNEALKWKCKESENVKIGRKNRNGSTPQTFIRSAVKECCNAVIIKDPNDSNEFTEKIVDTLNSTKNVITSNKKSALIINSICECNNSSDTCAIKNACCKIETLGIKERFRITNRKQPCLRIATTNKEATLDDTWKIIKEKTDPEIINCDPTQVTSFIHRNGKAKSFIIRVPASIRSSLAGINVKDEVNSTMIYIRDSIHVLYCRHCSKYGHSLKKCRYADPNTIFESPAKCTKCPEEHSPFNLNCSQRYRFIASRIANIDYGKRIYPQITLWQ